MVDVNNAAIAYYFKNKENLYNCVIREAHQWLATSEIDAASDLPPKARIQKIIENMCCKLSGSHSWVARIQMFEVLELNRPPVRPVSAGLWKELSQLETTIQDLLGAQTEGLWAHYCAINIIGQCVFSCVISENPQANLPIFKPLASQSDMARQLIDLLLNGLTSEFSAEANSAENNRRGK